MVTYKIPSAISRVFSTNLPQPLAVSSRHELLYGLPRIFCAQTIQPMMNGMSLHPYPKGPTGSNFHEKHQIRTVHEFSTPISSSPCTMQRTCHPPAPAPARVTASASWFAFVFAFLSIRLAVFVTGCVIPGLDPSHHLRRYPSRGA